MNQQEKMACAKRKVKENFRAPLKEFDQIDDFSFVKLVEVEDGGKIDEIYVVCQFTAKKKFDLDEALDNWAFKQEEEQRKKELQEKKKKKATK